MRRKTALVFPVGLLGLLGLAGCASSDVRPSDVRTVTDREELVGCKKLGIVEQPLSGVLSDRQLGAQAASLGGNTVILGNVRGHPYVEVWSCPAPAAAAPAP